MTEYIEFTVIYYSPHKNDQKLFTSGVFTSNATVINNGIMRNFHCKSWAVTSYIFQKIAIYNDERQINDNVIC